MTDHTPTEREQLIQDYLDGHVSRGGIVTDEIRAQAMQYAQRIADNKAYEAMLKKNAEKQRKMVEYATTDQALRERSNRRQLEASYINRFGSDNAPVTEELKQSARLYADRVLTAADPAVAQRAVRAATERLAKGQAQRATTVAALRADLAAQCGSNHWRDIRDQANVLKSTLDALFTQLFQEAMRPPQDDPQGVGDTPDASAVRGRRRTATTRKNA